MDRAEIRRLVESVPHWHHTFHFPGGVSTNGGYDPRGLLEQIELPDLTGLRVLDVGTRDGFFAFACERAGAREVVALDHVDPDVTGFEVARRILGSKVEYARENIYQISREKYGSFDLILFILACSITCVTRFSHWIAFDLPVTVGWSSSPWSATPAFLQASSRPRRSTRSRPRWPRFRSRNFSLLGDSTSTLPRFVD
jgi:hypothetical protein